MQRLLLPSFRFSAFFSCLQQRRAIGVPPVSSPPPRPSPLAAALQRVSPAGESQRPLLVQNEAAVQELQMELLLSFLNRAGVTSLTGAARLNKGAVNRSKLFDKCQWLFFFFFWNSQVLGANLIRLVSLLGAVPSGSAGGRFLLLSLDGWVGGWGALTPSHGSAWKQTAAPVTRTDQCDARCRVARRLEYRCVADHYHNHTSPLTLIIYLLNKTSAFLLAHPCPQHQNLEGPGLLQVPLN